ncbi:substrate-binding domain-containing protein [Dyadobacter fermentans]|uniref:histidine kinase n=1 Tax=Dyadobacter fermentans (strain ATCC 700827 / DSM 18053 / CIP 107007 / KCTC 52180 / NS114) TaxID=471854 RepID=C6VSM5_DYAFD|nr:substrate-binding domain-containing protein [Dyadobacter fermentans]ACT92847.1 two component transcriptional regulator, AraC family [Dyadobacter fermentans DSM 18053]
MRLALIALLLLTLFAGCAGKQEDAYVIGFSQCTGDDEWRRAMLDGMQRELAFHNNTKLIFRDAHANSAVQVKQIEELLRNGIHLLIVSPNESDPLTPVIEKAYKQGVPVVVVDRRTSSPYYTAYVGGDNYQVGKTVGEYAAALLGGNGKMIEITGLPRSSPASDRHRGLVDALATRPSIRRVATLNGQWQKDIAKSELRKVLPRFPDLDLIFAQNEVMAMGAREVCNDIFPDRKIRVIGVDGLPGQFGDIQMVYDGHITATALYPTGGEEAARVAMNILQKQPYQKENLLQTAIIDSSNVRMIKMQTDKMISQQNDIERQQARIDEQLEIYQTQRGLLYVMTGLFIVSIILGSVALYSLIENKKINRELNSKNEEIVVQRNRIQDIAEKAQEATESKFRFFTNISHEFRTPLTLILGPVEELLRQKNESPAVRKNLSLVQKNATRLLWLVNQLMDFRKIESGKIRLQVSGNDMVAFVRELMLPFDQVARKRRIDFRLVTALPALEVWFDRDMMDKVFFNLLSNAFKFTPDWGRIYIHISQAGENVVVSVQDNGSGLSDADMAGAFEMFYQGKNSTKGTGLGLPLSREFVELHQGTIAADGKKGEGAIFTVTLPLGQAHFQPEDLADAATITSAFGRTAVQNEPEPQPAQPLPADLPSVLLIEDNEDLLGFVNALLQDQYQVSTATDGRAGLDQCFETVPDLVVCDVMLPGMDGLEITAALKSDLRTSHIPVILLTAKNTPEQQVEGMQARADMYITKPFSPQFLQESIASLLANRQLLRNTHFGPGVAEAEAGLSRLDKKFVNELRALIIARLDDPALTVESLGKALGLSRVQLFRKTKALLGGGTNELILNLRLEKACTLLRNPDLTMAEIADQTGFTSQSYFSTVFKTHFGVSPKDWRMVRS